ncbi:hypothetical protein BNATCHR198 (nucleomorph) [Bigelowiella natans]|uniref:Uncharacterized protein n=1 Tax=Bigelowiella natans TaxID=227086 RepID=Q3LWI1_BIGNA|nr:hypothetical protein BNATCHR198 [Bigelowiella natans]ABA27185.1 hypothetical protein [Bigelowiella natans]
MNIKNNILRLLLKKVFITKIFNNNKNICHNIKIRSIIKNFCSILLNKLLIDVIILLTKERNAITSKLLVCLISININISKISKKVNNIDRFYHKIFEILLKKGSLLIISNPKIKANLLLKYSFITCFLILFISTSSNIYFVYKTKKKLMMLLSKYLGQEHFRFMKKNKTIHFDSHSFNYFFLCHLKKNYNGLQRIRKKMIKKHDAFSCLFYNIF